MHPALALPEILEAVFHQVDLQPASDSPTGTGYAALAIAARCCRHFCGPALDRLWAHMSDLMPLLHLLPGLLQLQGTFILHRSIRREEWTRLISYSKRIRVLHYTNDPSVSPNIDASVFMQLYRLSHHQPLFPRLQVLVFTAARLPVPELLIFQSDRLLRLDFHTKMDHTLLDHTFPSFLASLSHACHLRSLSIVGRTSHLFVASLSRFPLRSLTICRQPWRIDGTTLNTIAKLEHLVDLQLDLWETDFETVERSLHTMDLKKLSLRGDIRSISAFMKKFPIAPDSLRSVTLAEFDAGQTPLLANPWSGIFVACARHSSSLRSIKASIHNAKGAIPMRPCTPAMPFLEPLLECRLLHDIFMVGFPPISLHEQELTVIACTWPSLYSLSLPHSPSTTLRLRLRCIHSPTIAQTSGS
ncbi:hypothetical protein DFH06DRAFT_160104 [Mycena polygramma]|nr:hypothetical protein DFH06DRAFT_160104 [Mycena polygramma]